MKEIYRREYQRAIDRINEATDQEIDECFWAHQKPSQAPHPWITPTGKNIAPAMRKPQSFSLKQI
ncbi:protoheme ferro-lyase [Neorhizobium galegae]|uniref:hypothetical protein n=1 Tax=Neorhizobium galegae TaxID=399 RepID=UPI00277EF345|nr:hypothetical protein [Neorhizobium galegae]MDQ0132647.1 protoheme ferro-lyase [Neorhizobium galegae]